MVSRIKHQELVPQAHRPSFGGSMDSNGRTSQLQVTWRLLRMDEKRYLLCRPLLNSDIEAAERVGRKKSWLDQKRKVFKLAIELLPTWDFNEMKRLLDEDMLTLLRVDIAGDIRDLDISEGHGNSKDVIALAKTVGQLRQKADYSNADGVPARRGNMVDLASVRTWRDDEENEAKKQMETHGEL